MIGPEEWRAARDWAWERVCTTGLPLREDEREHIEVADLGLSELVVTGAQILTLVSTPWVSAKLLVLAPHQFFPQHRHPPAPTEGYPGKEETFRGLAGECWLYVPGEPAQVPRARPPAHRRAYLTVWHEVVLRPGDQFTCPPNTWHWFQAGPDGAIVWSISSKVTDAQDEFADPQVLRQTVIR